MKAFQARDLDAQLSELDHSNPQFIMRVPLEVESRAVEAPILRVAPDFTGEEACHCVQRAPVRFRDNPIDVIPRDGLGDQRLANFGEP